MSSAPYYYDYMNRVTSNQQPGTIDQCSETTNFFVRSLLQRAMSVFDFTHPKNWPNNYFLYTLFCNGFGIVTDTAKFGVIFQHGGLSGYNLYYQPTTAIIANPLYSADLTIGKNCEILQLQPDYCGVMDIVLFYAGKLASLTGTVDMNILNTRFSYIFAADDKAEAETFKTAFDKITAGNPAVAVTRKSMFDQQGNPKWLLFTQNVKENFVTPELLEAMRTIVDMFDAEIGIPHTAQKKERLVVDEVTRNDFETQCRVLLWLDTLKEGCERIRNRYGIELNVKLKEGVLNERGNTPPVQPGAV